jgi:biotin/methionine sulfoxide reductase
MLALAGPSTNRQDEEDASSEGNATMGETTEKRPAAASSADTPFRPHTSHWGVFSARMRDGELEVRPHAGDPDPNEIIQNFPTALRHRARIAQPMVRRGWLERGPGPDDRRGRDD